MVNNKKLFNDESKSTEKCNCSVNNKKKDLLTGGNMLKQKKERMELY